MNIIVEENESCGFKEVVGFTENHISFHHLRKEEFESAEFRGDPRLVEKLKRKFYRALKSQK